MCLLPEVLAVIWKLLVASHLRYCSHQSTCGWCECVVGVCDIGVYRMRVKCLWWCICRDT